MVIKFFIFSSDFSCPSLCGEDKQFEVTIESNRLLNAYLVLDSAQTSVAIPANNVEVTPELLDIPGKSVSIIILDVCLIIILLSCLGFIGKFYIHTNLEALWLFHELLC